MVAAAFRLCTVHHRTREGHDMCTVSIIFTGDRIRLACNRDEQVSRPMACPPEVRTFGSNVAAMPIDPQSDGTWIGVNDAGVMMALLNRTCMPGQVTTAGAIS